MTSRTLTFGATAYPVVLPSIRDPRLHVASVIITIHVLGQVGLHFQVSVPQILAAILTCAVLELAITFRRTRMFVWPASAMLTGSGVALILRVVGTPSDQPWYTDGWYLFAAIAGLSLMTKYVIQYRGTHVFNPSNIGLVVAFIVLGSGRIEPLDFWWGPLDLPMIVAYAVIITGGILITRRLHLLALAATFWVALTVGVGILSASGHCMTTNWAFAPVCGFDFWRVIVTSPEVLIFLFFMITDPKTVPGGQVGRVLFGFLVAVASTVLMAPQTNEFGTKVGLLTGLVLICAARPLIDRLVPEPRSQADTIGQFLSRLGGGSARSGAVRRAAGVGLAGVAVLGLSVVVVAAGTPARGAFVSPDVAEVISGAERYHIDPNTLPRISVGQDVADLYPELANGGAPRVVMTIAENLEIENQALLRRDGAILTAVDHGDRLTQMQGLLQNAVTSGETTITHYEIDDVAMSVIKPFGVQSGLTLGLSARGNVTEQTYDASNAIQSTTTHPFEQTFVTRRATGNRWLNVAVLPYGAQPEESARPG